jgi:hypothetical protein
MERNGGVQIRPYAGPGAIAPVFLEAFCDDVSLVQETRKGRNIGQTMSMCLLSRYEKVI